MIFIFNGFLYFILTLRISTFNLLLIYYTNMKGNKLNELNGMGELAIYIQQCVWYGRKKERQREVSTWWQQQQSGSSRLLVVILLLEIIQNSINI